MKKKWTAAISSVASLIAAFAAVIAAFAAVIAAFAAVIAAFAAINIPHNLHENAKKIKTLEIVNEMNREISDIVFEKIQLDENNCVKMQLENNCVTDEFHFNYQYIKGNTDVERLVYALLNEYAYLCLGGNKDLFDNNIIKQLRGNALNRTWNDYSEYMKQHRRLPGREDAWEQCDAWLKDQRYVDRREESVEANDGLHGRYRMYRSRRQRSDSP